MVLKVFLNTNDKSGGIFCKKNSGKKWKKKKAEECLFVFQLIPMESMVILHET